MQMPVVSAALAAVFVLAPAAAGIGPAWPQDFSITNQIEPADPAHRNLTRQLQAWWDEHAYYPKHASNNDEGGTVKLHLNILRDGRIWMVTLVESSGSRALDTAATAAFRSGMLRAFPEGPPETEIDLSVHYVLAHRHDQPVQAVATNGPSKRPFTIMNDPVTSPILETMLQRTCTGTVVRGGSRTRAWQGFQSWAQAIFFRKPDGTPWVRFYEGGQAVLSPVTQIGKMLQWVGPEEYTPKGAIYWTTWTVWADGPNHLGGAEGSPTMNNMSAAYSTGFGGPVDMTCAPEMAPPVIYNAALAQTMVTPPGDPP